MKYRIWPKINTIQSVHRDGTAKATLTQVFEIQRRTWFGWRYVETWASEPLAMSRVLQLTGPDRPTTWWTRFWTRVQERFAESATLVKRRLWRKPRV